MNTTSTPSPTSHGIVDVKQAYGEMIPRPSDCYDGAGDAAASAGLACSHHLRAFLLEDLPWVLERIGGHHDTCTSADMTRVGRLAVAFISAKAPA